MTNKERVELYLSPEAKEAFEKAVVEHFGQLNGFKSQAGEMALREWADRDRDARIEDKLDRVLEHVAPDTSEDELERERSNSNSGEPQPEKSWPTGRVGNSLTSIEEQLPSNGTVSEDDIETAIEEHGGTAYKTVNKYWNLIEKHNLAMEIPDGSNEYAVSELSLAFNCEQRDEVSAADVRNVVGEYADDFGADLDYPEEWYLEALEDEFAEHSELKFSDAPDLDAGDWRMDKFGHSEPLSQLEENESPDTASDDDVGVDAKPKADDVVEEMAQLKGAMTDGGNS